MIFARWTNRERQGRLLERLRPDAGRPGEITGLDGAVLGRHLDRLRRDAAVDLEVELESRAVRELARGEAPAPAKPESGSSATGRGIGLFVGGMAAGALALLAAAGMAVLTARGVQGLDATAAADGS